VVFFQLHQATQQHFPQLQTINGFAVSAEDEGSDLLFKEIDIENNRLVALQLVSIGITQQELEHGVGC
jgi:hypothetical protein